MSVPRVPAIWQLPDSLMVKMRFSDYYTFDAGAGVLNVTSFTGNGVFDPQVAAGGGSPSTLANWASFYRKYKVMASEISLSVLNDDASRAMIGIIARRPDAAVVATSTNAQQTLTEGANGVYRTLPIAAQMFKPVEFGIYRTTREMVPLDIMDSTLAGLSETGNPTVLWYWDVVTFNPDTSTAGATVTGTVTIDYYVEMFEYSDPRTD